MLSVNLHFTEIQAPFRTDLYNSEGVHSLVVTAKDLQQVVMFFDSREAALKVGLAFLDVLDTILREIDEDGKPILHV